MKKIPQLYKMVCKILEIEPCFMLHVGDEWYFDFISPRSIGVKSFYLDRTGEKGGNFVIKDLRGMDRHLTR